ncbi:DUF924 family protein [Comamonas odontotermitis]|uniref:DUF924 family protein n=1 Tax=Comamonas odontotermitis TaxID=379895 RepID=UPI001CC79E74|nr:DUF924 family protein [Comamonas odontotermitis]UBB17017.1 DUF924 domain-containing protein [Comamonas odontotermitis]
MPNPSFSHHDRPAPTGADDVLQFWLGTARPDNAQALQQRQQWFTKSDAFDAEMRQRFGAAVQAALDGQLDGWATEPWGRLALILLLDQFTRNIHRGTPQAFAGDRRALELALGAIESGEDLHLPEVLRIFVYLPLEHAEDPAMQRRSVLAFAALAKAAGVDTDLVQFLQGTLDYAWRHQEVIARFGRFPHRNAVLGRTSTPDELFYLSQPGAGF